MRDLFDYISAAMQNSQCKSERKLCDMLDISNTSITNYRNKGVIPTSETMLKLAKLAGVPEWQALLDLQEWRAENENEKAIWRQISEKIKTAALILVTAGQLGASPALAGNVTQNFQNVTNENVALCERYCILRKLSFTKIKAFLSKVYQWLM